MGEEGLEHIKAFISKYIDSVVQLEVLLLIHKEPDRPWSATEVSQRLRVSPAWVVDELANLCNRGLLVRVSGPEIRYRFASHAADLCREVQSLADVYADRRVTIISLIGSKPIDRIRVFTDAFKLRKDGSDA